MENNELKEVIRNYILENKEKMYEAPEDDQDDEEVVDDAPEKDASGDFIQGILASDPSIAADLGKITNPRQKIDILDGFIDFVLNAMGRNNIPSSDLRNYALRKFANTDQEVNEESTTAGVPAPATKYAYKLKKKND